MTNSDLLIRNQINNYLILAQSLRAQYAGIDEETLTDTLEGMSDLPDVIGAIVRSSLNDGAFIEALKGRIQDLELRLERFKDRYERKRALARWAMVEAGLEKIMAADFSLGLRKGTERLEVFDETSIPKDYFIEQTPKLDRRALTEALKRGQTIAGAELVMGEPSIQVRVR